MSERDIVERLENEAKVFEQTLPDETVDLIRESASEIARLREERRLREALWQACAKHTRLVYGNVFAPQPLPPGPEGDG